MVLCHYLPYEPFRPALNRFFAFDGNFSVYYAYYKRHIIISGRQCGNFYITTLNHYSGM